MITVIWRQSWFAPGNKATNTFKSMKAFGEWRNQPKFLNIEIIEIKK